MPRRFLRRKKKMDPAAVAQWLEPQKTFRHSQSGLRGGIYRVAYEIPELSEALCTTGFYIAVYPSIDEKTVTIMLKFQKEDEYIPSRSEIKTHSQPLKTITPEEIVGTYSQLRMGRDIFTPYQSVLLYQDTLDKMINWWN